MKPITHHPSVNHRNIINASRTREVFFAPEKNYFKNQGTTDCRELDATKKSKFRHHFGTKLINS